MIKQTRVLAKFKVPRHFAQWIGGETWSDFCMSWFKECITGLYSHSMSMIGSYRMVEPTLSPRCLRSTPKLLLLKRREGGEERSRVLNSYLVLWGTAFNNHSQTFFKKFTHKMYACSLESFNASHRAKDFKTKGPDSQLYKHNSSQGSFTVNPWTGNLFGKFKYWVSLFKTLWSDQGHLISATVFLGSH